MSSGALVQLSAVGQINEYATICPEVTFFKGFYKRHTNFSRVPIENQFCSAIGFGRKLTSTVQRTGDLVTQVYLVMKLSALNVTTAQSGNQIRDLNGNLINVPVDANGVPTSSFATWTNEVGHAAIDWVDCIIGGQRMDQHSGIYLGVWESLSYHAGKRQGSMVGFFTNVPDLLTFSLKDETLYVPMMFWFNRCTEQALPLIALQYHETKFEYKLRTRAELITYYGLFTPEAFVGAPTDYSSFNQAQVTGGELTDAYLLINYVYLDTMERRVFATNAHEYFIDQLQMTDESKPAGATQRAIPLYFNHICKELIFVLQRNALIDENKWFDFSGIVVGSSPQVGDPTADPLVSAKIQLNSHDLFSEKDALYFRKVVPYETHSDIPDYFVYVFSFALDPENWKPTGGCNLSRIDNVILKLQYQDFDGVIRIYCRSVNLLKVISGMAGIKYAN